MNYTNNETKELITTYTSCKSQDERNSAVTNLARKFNKSVYSIRAKLVAENVYVSNKRKSKITGGTPKSKEKMVDEMEEEFNFEIGELEGLEKAPKLVIVALYDKIKTLTEGSNEKK